MRRMDGVSTTTGFRIAGMRLFVCSFVRVDVLLSVAALRLRLALSLSYIIFVYIRCLNVAKSSTPYHSLCLSLYIYFCLYLSLSVAISTFLSAAPSSFTFPSSLSSSPSPSPQPTLPFPRPRPLPLQFPPHYLSSPSLRLTKKFFVCFNFILTERQNALHSIRLLYEWNLTARQPRRAPHHIIHLILQTPPPKTTIVNLAAMPSLLPVYA